jgi:signal transduction histidine kinase/ActR/RegA family two-component response regulator
MGFREGHYPFQSPPESYEDELSISTFKFAAKSLRYTLKWFLLGLSIVSITVSTADCSADPLSVHVGVLAKQGPENYRTKRQPIAEHLSKEKNTSAAKAANISDWTYPLSDLRTHDCLTALELGPYDHHSPKNMSAIFPQHTQWFVWGAVIFLGICISAVFFIKLNNRLSTMKADFLREVVKRKKIEAKLHESDYNLRSALAMAYEANRSKNEFLANMSHELRTPMNGIIGMTSILQNSDLTNEQLEFSNIIMRSSEGLLCIINDILDYSHIAAGQSKLDSTDFDLFSLVNSVVKTISTMAEEKGLQFTFSVDENVPAHLKGDGQRILKIIKILMSNAVKFTHQGMISLQISMAEDRGNKCTLRNEVIDTGIGIATDHQTLIFNPFSQVDYSSTRKYGGTGIGLALAKHFTEMMGGSIEVKSTPGEGSIFCFTVPLEKQSFAAHPKPKISSVITKIPNPSHVIAQPPPIETGIDRPHILVVEDNIINQKVMLNILGKHEYHAKVVDNGRKALHELQKNAYDLVLMDIQMPEMDGFEATTAIRDPQNNCLDPQIPIIAVTANTTKADRASCLKAGMNDYLPKPVNSKKLMGKVKKWQLTDDRSQCGKTDLSNR